MSSCKSGYSHEQFWLRLPSSTILSSKGFSCVTLPVEADENYSAKPEGKKLPFAHAVDGG